MTKTSLEPVEIRTDRLLLRDFTTADLDGVYGIVGDDAVTSWLSFNTRCRDEAQTMLTGILERQQAQPRSEYYLAITPADTPPDVIGFIRLGLGGVQAADLGYALLPSHWGQGLAYEAATAMIDFAFTALGLHRLTANIGPANAASIRLVQTLGFSYEGTIRDHVHTNGAWRDSRSYSLLAPEWADAATCENCSNRVPASPRGRARKFCSTACRQAAHRRARATATD